MKRRPARIPSNIQKELEVSLGQLTSNLLQNYSIEQELGELKSLQNYNPIANKVILALLEIMELPRKASITSLRFPELMANISPEKVPQWNLDQAKEYISKIRREEIESISEAGTKFYDAMKAIMRYRAEQLAKQE